MILASYPFTDITSGRHVVLHIDDDIAPGIEHPGCGQRADVSPDLDAFYCRACGWVGRISGAWYVDMLTLHADLCATCGAACGDDDCECDDACHKAQAVADSAPYLPDEIDGTS